MCGIVGIAGTGTNNAPVDINALLALLHHRGPDSQGSCTLAVAGRSVVLGHTRLAILDLTPSGHQPIASRDGRWWLTFNGEIYNHLALRASLPGRFRGHSDTETLVEALAAYGIEATLPKLNGMFAFCAVDTLEKKLYLARDPFGIKPLYYRENGEVLSFASEARALRALEASPPKVDREALQTFLTLRYVPSPRTLWENVLRLPPGHCLTRDLASGATDLRCFIKPTAERFEGSLAEAVRAYHDQLRLAVERQLLSDVPVGILLSGGIDSALVAALAREQGRELPCFSVGFGGNHAECELDAAAETAAVLGFPFVPVTVSPEELWDAVPGIVNSVEEPLGTTSILPMWYLVHRARRDVTVVLTGQGSDEPWGGYTRYQSEVLRRLLPAPAILKGPGKLADRLLALPEFAQRALRSIPVADIALRFEEAYALFTSEERRLLTGDSGDGCAIQDIRRWLRWAAPVECQPVEKMMRIDSRMNLADDLLIYGDKISMATALETRVPMLDIELVRFVESLPIAYRVGINARKVVHKKLAETFLPSAIVHRPKRAFQVPFGAWLRGEWRDRVGSTLFESNAPYSEMIDVKSLRQLWDSHQSGARDHSRKLYALFILAMWWKQL
jgi:asparagine synthase (glutamine-hydrolysing)